MYECRLLLLLLLLRHFVFYVCSKMKVVIIIYFFCTCSLITKLNKAARPLPTLQGELVGTDGGDLAKPKPVKH
jgi:hypothetical protein